MKGQKSKLFALRGKKNRGYTLLEYCAGAAIIAGIIWAALTLLSNHLNDLLDGIGQWVGRRTTELQNDNPFAGGNNGGGNNGAGNS